MALKLNKHVQLSGIICCLTGLRIGAGQDDIEIGGMENPIIRHPLTRLPYIPGSSLKGKIRSLLEYKYCAEEVTKDGRPCGCAKEDCPVCVVFGAHTRPELKIKLGPTRIIVRDAMLTQKSADELDKLQEAGLQYAEVKAENIIDRRTGVAADKGFRSQERVPAGAEFEFCIVLRVFEGDDEERMVELISEGLKMLEQDYLGGSGSRGYGEVELCNLERDGQSWTL